MRKSLTQRMRSSPLVNPWIAVLSTAPAIASIVVLALIPAIVNVVLSFTDYSQYGASFEWVGLRNYAQAFMFKNEAGVSILQSLLNSVIFSVCVVLVQQTLSLGSALLLSRNFKGHSFFRAVYFVPTILGISVIGFIWQLVLLPFEGPVYKFLRLFGISSGLLGEKGTSMALVIFITIWANFGYAMAVYIAGIQDISNDVKEAAQIDGVSSRQMLRYITFPLLKNTLVINFWISISGTLAMCDIIFVLTGGAFGTTTFAVYIFNIAMATSTNKGQGVVFALIFFVFVSAVMLTFNAIFRRKEKDV